MTHKLLCVCQVKWSRIKRCTILSAFALHVATCYLLLATMATTCYRLLLHQLNLSLTCAWFYELLFFFALLRQTSWILFSMLIFHLTVCYAINRTVSHAFILIDVMRMTVFHAYAVHWSIWQGCWITRKVKWWRIFSSLLLIQFFIFSGYHR